MEKCLLKFMDLSVSKMDVQKNPSAPFFLTHCFPGNKFRVRKEEEDTAILEKRKAEEF